MSDSTWQEITPDNPPKAPCVLLHDAGMSSYVAKDERAIRICLAEPSNYTHWTPLPPAKHPAEVAFDHHCALMEYSMKERFMLKTGAQWFAQYAAKELCRSIDCPFGVSPFDEMRDRLTKAAEGLK